MPRHTIGTRPLEGEERDRLGPAEITKTDEWGCAVGVLAIAAVIGCTLGAALQVVLSTLAQMRFLPFVMTVVLVVIAWRVASAIRKTERETLTRAAQDRTEDAAQVIEVWDPIVVQQDGDDAPAYFLDIGRDSVLALVGPETRDIPVVRLGRPWLSGDEVGERDWEPPFLNSHIVVHRGRRSGRVFRIDLFGEPLAVSRVLPAATVPLSGLRPSALIDGTLETLAEDLARRAETTAPPTKP
jgi:membrane protein implicated in regulation of membrane protease activity